MYENSFNNDTKKQLKEFVNQGDREKMLSYLQTELKSQKLPVGCILSYCSCGYPIGFYVEEIDNKNESSFRTVYLEEILKSEINFRAYTETISCPNCNQEILER